MDAISAALDGLRSAEEMLDASARRIARFPGTALAGGTVDAEAALDVVDLSAAVVGLLEARNAYSANIKVLEATMDLRKNLIDVLG